MHIHKQNMQKGSFYQNMPNYPFRDLMQSQVSHINQPNMLTISTSNTYPNILETMIYYNPITRNNITRMNKSQSYHNKQDNYSWILIKSTSAMTKQSPITLLNQVSSTRKHDQCPTLHIMAFGLVFHRIL